MFPNPFPEGTQTLFLKIVLIKQQLINSLVETTRPKMNGLDKGDTIRHLKNCTEGTGLGTEHFCLFPLKQIHQQTTKIHTDRGF